MGLPYRELADAQADIVRWDGHQLALMSRLALAGSTLEMPLDASFAGWRDRLRCLRSVGRLLEELAAGRLALVPGPAAADSPTFAELVERIRAAAR